jgi:hypothetical protein
MDLRLVPLPAGLHTRWSLPFRGPWLQEPGDSRPLSGRQHPLDVGGYFMGIERGYFIWQSLPNPPEEAFSDTHAAAGLFLGWLASLVFLGCLNA